MWVGIDPPGEMASIQGDQGKRHCRTGKGLIMRVVQRTIKANRATGMLYIELHGNYPSTHWSNSRFNPGERVAVRPVLGGVILRSVSSTAVIEECHWDAC